MARNNPTISRFRIMYLISSPFKLQFSEAKQQWKDWSAVKRNRFNEAVPKVNLILGQIFI